MYDRYLLPVIPLVAAGIASLSPPATAARTHPWLPAAAALLAAFFLFSVCGTRDYLAWNRTRWEALNDLMKSQALKPSEIDGGLEFDAYHYFLADPRSQSLPGKDSSWTETVDTYRVTFHPMPDFSILRKYPYHHWMPPYSGNIFALKANLPVASKMERTAPTLPEK
jgi:hypothetical protein